MPSTQKYLAKARRLRREYKLLAYGRLGNKCNNPECGWRNPDGSFGCLNMDCLQIDHVKDDGYEERKKIRGYYFYLLVLADTTGKYQLLCANCNWIKRAAHLGLSSLPSGQVTACLERKYLEKVA